MAALCPYLAALGVSHLYLSPYLTAAPNSVHGYDVTDPGTVDEALGGADGYRRLLTALEDHGLRLLVDLVPNHMSISQGSNPWWQDVLASGPGSARAGYFDINWESPDPRLAGRVLVPVLAQSYGATLAAGKFHLARVGT
ncbi:MAG: alpha-amylase family glycosyl hydrolase, partial [Candidatus Dormibacteria bacterium]